MEVPTGAVTTGSNHEDGRGVHISPESPRIREYFDLRDALAEPGCPVCARVILAGREALATIAAEPSSGTPARKALLPSRGLCNAHAWGIRQILEMRTGLADAYEVLLRDRIGALHKLMSGQRSGTRQGWSGWVRSWGGAALARLLRRSQYRRCLACRSAERVERRDLDLILDLITDMEFARAFETSAGLCLPHLNLLLRLAPDHPNLPRLLEAQIPKVKRLHADLQDFLRQAKAPLATLTHEEHEAIWRRVLEWTAGKAGVFGHERDLALGSSALPTLFKGAPGSRVRDTPLSPGGGAGRMDEVERLSLENAKLQRRLVEVSREWAEESARRAALQFQVHKLTEDVKVLELNLAGARGEAKSGDVQAARLREEIQALRDEIRRLRAGHGEPPDSLLEEA